jgi:DNA repair exonuclease SbcCD ATPase subunit
MQLKFKTISIERFRSFKDKAVINFDDAGSGLYFVKGKNLVNPALGPNGAGKSSIIDALLWCLYGKTVQGLKNPDIAPWTGKGTTSVEVTLMIAKESNIIKRTANPNKLTINGAEAGQEYVDKLIAIPFEILPYTIILGQRKPLFYDLTASEKLKLFSEVLNLDRWETRSAHASELVKSLDREIASKETELEMHQKMQEQMNADFTKLKQQSADWEEQRSKLIETATQQKQHLHQQIIPLAKQRDDADLKLERAETELRASKIETFRKQYNVALNEIVKFEETLKTAVRSKAVYDAELISIQDCICPTCKQETDKTLTKNLRADYTKKIKTCDEQIAICTKSITTSKEIRDQVLTKFENEEAAIAKFKQEAEEARDVLDRLLPKISGWEGQIRAIDQRVQESSNDNNPYTEQLQTLRRRRDQNKSTIETTTESIKTKTEYSERVRFWVKGFKDIKLLQVEEILQELQITTNGMLEEFGLVGWEVTYDIERETKSKTVARGLNIVINSPENKNTVKWECWSGGEGQRLRLIGTAALSSVLLNHVGVSTNVEFYDEPTESLSKEGIQDLVDFLAQRAKDTKKAIWMIDHHTVESSKFVSVITVTKDKNGSHIDAQ